MTEANNYIDICSIPSKFHMCMYERMKNIYVQNQSSIHCLCVWKAIYNRTFWIILVCSIYPWDCCDSVNFHHAVWWCLCVVDLNFMNVCLTSIGVYNIGMGQISSLSSSSKHKRFKEGYNKVNRSIFQHKIMQNQIRPLISYRQYIQNKTHWNMWH